MKAILRHRTRVGAFYIAQSSDARFHLVFNDESLGSYINIAQAVDDLVHNATFSVLHPVTSELLDTSELGIPEDPGEWEHVFKK